MSKIKKALKEIAQREGISITELKREMQLTINEIYENPNDYARCVPSKGKVPTVEEFLEYSIKMAKALIE